MRETPQLGINYNKKRIKIFPYFKVKTFMTRGQFACNSYTLLHQRLNVVHSNSYSTLTALTINLVRAKDLNFFKRWLIGIVDAKGQFLIICKKDQNFQFCISLALDNLRVLYYIKSKLKIGQIVTTKNNNLAHFKIKDLAQIEKVILPIFDEYPL